MNIVLLDAFTTNPGDVVWTALDGLGAINYYDHSTKEEGIQRAQHADILVVNKFVVDDIFLTQVPNLKYIVVSATGYNNVDTMACGKRGISVSNVRAYSTNSVAQHVFSHLLSVLNHPRYYHETVREDRWTNSRDFCYFHHSIEEIAGKTFGIVGFGEIGKKIATIATAFDAEVLVHTRTVPSENIGGVRYTDLETCLQKSDFLTLHAPLTEVTKHMINSDSLAKMKPNAILINTGRGPLIQEDDLVKHLKDNKDFKAIIDVMSTEPPTMGSELFALENCYVSPHIAWASKQARQTLIEGVAKNIIAYQAGHPINVVNG